MEARVIDWSRANELRDEVGAEDFDEVVEIFLIEMDEVMDGLRADPEAGVAAETLHFLKGSALNLGFRELGALCARGERQARTETPVPASEVIGAYQRARTAFLAGARSGPTAA